MATERSSRRHNFFFLWIFAQTRKKPLQFDSTIFTRSIWDGAEIAGCHQDQHNIPSQGPRYNILANIFIHDAQWNLRKASKKGIAEIAHYPVQKDLKSASLHNESDPARTKRWKCSNHDIIIRTAPQRERSNRLKITWRLREWCRKRCANDIKIHTAPHRNDPTGPKTREVCQNDNKIHEHMLYTHLQDGNSSLQSIFKILAQGPPKEDFNQ
jgi:hypothetical protein